jgi:PhzF family phenazine biosynthesis protein
MVIYQVDAFTSKACKGNPAAVCLVDRDIENEVLLDIAAEMNLSETAFIQPLTDGAHLKTVMYSIRWFTPQMEMPLCGHATLAAAKVIFDCLGFKGDRILFKSMSGELESGRHAKGFTLDFPEDEPMESGPATDLLEAMGIQKYKKIWRQS